MTPNGAKLFPLQAHSKVPMPGTRGHLDALPSSDVAIVGNYGIALDKQFLLVDIDRPEDPIALEWGTQLPETWMQKTPRGTHRLYKLPDGFDGKNSRFPAGDLKVRGYLVGPGSEVDGKPYYMLEQREPAEAPPWLLRLVDKDQPSQTSINGELVLNERQSIAIGENDTELYSIACNLRRRGFHERAIAKMLQGIIDSGVVDMVPGSEYKEKDVARLARQAAKYDPEYEIGGLLDEEWISAEDIPLVGPPIRWWTYGFVPREELVMVYGKGAVGKSSWASWLAADVTRHGGKFVFVGVEEPFARFAARSILGGADRSRLYAIPHASSFVLPRDAEKLRDQIILSEADVVYFDSIYSHFSSIAGENAAERARKCLAPLADIANATGCTVVAVFHENKAGDYLGSVEMVNVARYVLLATRHAGGPLRISVAKTNLIDPGKSMQFFATDTEFRDPETGRVQLEEKEDGALGPVMLKVLDRGADYEGQLLIEDVEDEGATLATKVAAALDEDPAATATDIAKKIGRRKADVLEVVKAIRGSQ